MTAVVSASSKSTVASARISEQATAAFWNNPAVVETYSKLGEHHWYQLANNRLVALAELQPGQTVVDLGCGPAVNTLGICNALQRGRLISYDVSLQAVSRVQKQDGFPEVCCDSVIASASHAKDFLKPKLADHVLMINWDSSKELPALLEGLSIVLKSGARVSLSTGFSAAASNGESQKLVREIKRFVKMVLKDNGLPAPSTNNMVLANALTQGQYEKVFQGAGLRICRSEVQSQVIPIECVRDYLAMPGVSERFIPKGHAGISEENRQKHFGTAVQAALQGIGKDTIRRNWLYLVAEKAA